MGIKISALPSASTPLTGGEPVAIVQGGVTKKVPNNEFLKTDVLIATDPTELILDAGSWLIGLLILPSANADIKVGTTAGGDELLGLTHILAVDGLPQLLTMYSTTNDQSLFFTGLPSGTIVKLFIKQA